MAQTLSMARVDAALLAVEADFATPNSRVLIWPLAEQLAKAAS